MYRAPSTVSSTADRSAGTGRWARLKTTIRRLRGGDEGYHASVGLPLSAPVSERVGGYDVLLPIGTGGMGTVHFAEREVAPGVRRAYAIKVLHPHLEAEEQGQATELFLREAQLAARVRHPNVVTVHDTAHEGGRVYLVMDYVEGADLGQLLRAARERGVALPIEVVGRIACDVLDGLHAAHQACDDTGRALGIIHRDVSPQNVLVGVDGHSRLTDFGVAKASDGRDATATGVVKGKVGYMAPEQATGKPLDRRCDVYAAGVLLWEGLTGRRLFDADTDAERLLRIVSGPPAPRVSTLRAEVSAEIDDVVRAALERDPRVRTGDAEALRRATAAAWREYGLATPAEVGRLVLDLAGDRIERRRQRLAEVRDARAAGPASVASLRAAGAEMPGDAGEDATAAPSVLRAVGALDGDASLPFTGETRTAPLRRTGGWATAVFLGAAIAGAAGMVWYQARAAAPQRLEARLGGIRVEVAPVAAEAAAAPATTTVQLRLRADAPLAEVRIGAETFPLRVHSREVSVPRPSLEHGASLPVLAVATDGRRVSAEVGADTEELALRFSGQPRPRARPRPAAARDDGPRLAPNAYGDGKAR